MPRDFTRSRHCQAAGLAEEAVILIGRNPQSVRATGCAFSQLFIVGGLVHRLRKTGLFGWGGVLWPLLYSAGGRSQNEHQPHAKALLLHGQSRRLDSNLRMSFLRSDGGSANSYEFMQSQLGFMGEQIKSLAEIYTKAAAEVLNAPNPILIKNSGGTATELDAELKSHLSPTDQQRINKLAAS